MNIALNPSQIRYLVQNSVNQCLNIYEQDAGTDSSAQQPQAGTSSQQSGGQGYPEVGKWESGIQRGPANQVAVTKWSDIVGSALKRDKANQLKEQLSPEQKLSQFAKEAGDIEKTFRNMPRVDRPGSDYFSDVAAMNRRNLKSQMITILSNKYFPVSKYVYKEDDGEGFFLNLIQGEISEALLDLRSFMFSTVGITTQIVVGIAGAEVGAPVVLEAIDAAIILNDVYLFLTQGIDKMPPDNIKSPWERFKWLLFNNVDFLRLMEDLLIVLTYGLIKGASAIIKYFQKSSERFAKFLINSKNFFSNIWKLITKLPKRLGEFFKDKFGFIKKIIDFFEKLAASPSKSARVIAKVPKAVMVATVTTLVFELGMNAVSKLLNLDKITLSNPESSDLSSIESKANEYVEMSKNDKLLEDGMYEVSKVDFPTLKRENFRISKGEKKGKEQVFIINGAKYFVNNEGKFQKI